MKSMRPGTVSPPWLVAAFAACLMLPCLATAAGKVHTVRIEGMKFVPEHIEVSKGDTIDWVNNDIVPHTVSAPAASIESGSIEPKTHWKWTASRTAGIAYVCRFHPGMRGTLRVD